MYGGTGLSLPSIWAGSVGVHKQYVTPFAPMNTLEKLLMANRYRRAMSVDVLMQQLLLPPAPDVELDRGIRTMDYDFCRTLEELESRFPATGAGQPPVFGYSLPQNLHVSNILSASVPAGEAYPGFHAPYASRVRRVDRCFGAFVDFLKRRHQYERSVIIVTSDHGEMLGEEGRWGHAYYLFPQVLRTPLIVHLPPSTRVAPPPDLDAISLLTDIAPTVYGALGYQPRPANRLMGASLVGDAPVDFERRRRDSFVVAASYSAVYAVVRGNGRHVYIVDAINSTDYAYDRDAAGAWTAVGVTAGMRDNGQRIIREHIDEIRHVYHMPPSN
jgi:arylsulfatase A-like enzyme